MGFAAKIARGVGEVAGFESAQTYDIKMIVRANNPKQATSRAKEMLKAQGIHRGSYGLGGHRRMFTNYVAWGYADEVDGRPGFSLTHKKSLKMWQKSLAEAGYPSNVPVPFDSVGSPDFVDTRIDESNLYDGTAWLVNAWLGNHFPHIGPISL